MKHSNSITELISKAVNLIFLSLLWGIFCLPVVTIIPATAALYFTVVKSIRKGRGRVWPVFRKSFFESCRVGIPATLLLLTVIVLTLFNGKIALSMDSGASLLLLFCDALLLLLALFALVWVPAVVARFQTSFVKLMRCSVQLALAEIGITLLLLMLLISAGFMTILSGGLALFFVPSLIAYLDTLLMEKHLNRCIGEDRNPDKWYLDRDADQWKEKQYE